MVCRKTALVCAAENDFVHTATELIDAGADLNAKLLIDGCAHFLTAIAKGECEAAAEGQEDERDSHLSLQRLQSKHRITARAPGDGEALAAARGRCQNSTFYRVTF